MREHRSKSARRNYRATKRAGQQSGDTPLYPFQQLISFLSLYLKLCYILSSSRMFLEDDDTSNLPEFTQIRLNQRV